MDGVGGWVRRLFGHAFEGLGLHRVSLYVYTHNPRARRAYEKVGFVAEGVERETLWQGGEWIDAVRMSVLAPEWATHRGRPDGGRPHGGQDDWLGRVGGPTEGRTTVGWARVGGPTEGRTDGGRDDGGRGESGGPVSSRAR